MCGVDGDACRYYLGCSGEVERLNARYNVGLYNAADNKYDTVPSGEFRQRTIVQNGRTFLGNVSVRF